MKSKDLEIERKFIIKNLSLNQMKEIWERIIKVEDITQWYIKSEKDETIRLREVFTLGKNNIKYIKTIKQSLSTGISHEEEEQINEKKAKRLAEKRDENTAIIYKTRYTFEYLGNSFELDIFHNKEIKGLIFLEIELESLTTKLELPMFLYIKKEVTTNKQFKNHQLAMQIRNKQLIGAL